MSVGAGYADVGGNFDTTGQGEVTLKLEGKYARMNDNCGSSSLTLSVGSTNADWGTSGGTDCK